MGIVSGGDPHAVSQAIDEGLDLFVTGDASHEIYHEALEAGINVLFGGHYATEMWGVKADGRVRADAQPASRPCFSTSRRDCREDRRDATSCCCPCAPAIVIARPGGQARSSSGPCRSGQIVEVSGDFLWLWHVRNTAMAFSLGAGLPAAARVPCWSRCCPWSCSPGSWSITCARKDLTRFQRWCFAAILGGGVGQPHRPHLPASAASWTLSSVQFYGIFGMQRWPTFNVADSTVVVAGIALLVSFVREGKQEKSE